MYNMTVKKSILTPFTKQMLLYSLVLGLLLVALKLLEINLIVIRHSFEVYAGIVALLFCAVGIWVGIKFVHVPKPQKIVVEVQGKENWQADEKIIEQLGISKREYEVLQLIAQGHTNQEVADKLFVSANTIKTHTANLFAKLDVNRRTQAIQRAKDLNIIQ